MSPDEQAKAKADLTNSLLELLDGLSPLLDAAEGLKADLERRGWSPTAAEAVALEWLMNAQRFAWQQAKP